MPWWFWGGEICPKCCSCQAGLQKVPSKATARGTRRAHCTLQCVWRGHLIASREAAQQSSTGQMAKQRRENKPMGSHGSFAGDTCRIMWHFAHFGGDDSKSVTDWNRCFNQSWRQCQEENKLCYTTIHSRKLTTSQVTASIPWAAKGAVLGSGVRLERRKVDCLERRKVDRLEPRKVTPTET